MGLRPGKEKGGGGAGPCAESISGAPGRCSLCSAAAGITRISFSSLSIPDRGLQVHCLVTREG